MSVLAGVAKKLNIAVSALFGQRVERTWIGKPPNWKMGVIALACFGLAKLVGRNPNEIATEVAQKLEVEGLQANATGGYVNVAMPADELFGRICKLAQRSGYGARKLRNPIRVMVEYLSPNTNKPLHLGHIRNGVLGMAISRILEFTGYAVVKANLVNDRGIHICKSMIAWRRWGNGATPESTGIKPDHFVGLWYVRFEQELKAQITALRSERDELADKSDQELFGETELGRAAQTMLIAWEDEDPDVRDLWQMMNTWVYAGFAETYELLGFEFNEFLYESQTYLLGKDLVDEGLSRGLFVRDNDGAAIVRLPIKNKKYGKRVVQGFGAEKGGEQKKTTVLRADGTSVYLTQDLGTAQLKHDVHGADESIYVVASEQEHHFRVLFSILAMLGFEWSKGCHHRSYGMVKLPEGRMKSREGKVVDADDLVREVRELAAAEIASRDPELSAEQVSDRAAAIADAAVKFSLLSVAPANDIKFDPSKSLEFEGKTGPYVMYAYARCCAISGKASANATPDFSKLGMPEEIEIAMLLDAFPGVVRRAANDLDPSFVASHAFELAQAFSKFYHACPVLTAEPGLMEARLELVEATRKVLESCLWLIGIKPLQNM